MIEASITVCAIAGAIALPGYLLHDLYTDPDIRVRLGDFICCILFAGCAGALFAGLAAYALWHWTPVVAGLAVFYIIHRICEHACRPKIDTDRISAMIDECREVIDLADQIDTMCEEIKALNI